MLDIKFIRENPDAVKENIRKKFQNAKLPLVDEVIALDAEKRAAENEGNDLRAQRNKLSKQVGMLMGQAKKDPSKLEEAEAVKAQVKADADRLAQLEEMEEKLSQQIHHILLVIPQMIDPSVPIGKDDSCNVEVERFGEATVPAFDIPYHTDIMERFDGIDLDAAGRVSGNGFYYLMGDIARLHEAVLAYGRDFMINKGFTYCIPPFMIHGSVVEGVMSQTDMDAMMYKIEGEDLYLIGTSEHSMIGKFIDQIVPVESLPQTLTSYSPCFRKEKGAHGIEERGIYRIHQFEKQEMIVVCKPEDSKAWYEKLWRYSVELFRSLDIPVRQLECCSGDLADLKCKSCDIEAWSPRQQKYFEVCSCSNLGDAQARRLKIRYKDESGRMQLCHTLNNTCVAPPRMLIAFLENNLQPDGTVLIPKVLQPYMGGCEKLGVVIGGAFGKITTSLVNDVIMPLVGMLIGGIDLGQLDIVLKPAVMNGDEVVTAAVTLGIGTFLTTIIDFILVALVIFLMIKAINRFHKKKEEAPAPEEPKGPTSEELLTEIRDLLKEKNQ